MTTASTPHSGNAAERPCGGDISFAERERIDALQAELLREHVRYAARHSPFYRERLGRAGIDAESIRVPKDLAAIPCTSKDDLAESPEAFLAVDRNEIVDVCLTSSTTRPTPTPLLQTRSDLERLARNEAGSYALAGFRRGDRLMICVAIDRCFMAGLAYFLGGMEAGLELVRAGSASAAQAWELARQTRPTALVGVPSMMRHIGEAGAAEGQDPAALGVRRLLAIGDSVRDGGLELTPAAAALEGMWGARVFGTYASTEMATAFTECEAHAGGHLRPELVTLEILDDEDRACAPGVCGEAVVTPMGVRGMPLLRFRTGDIAYLIDELCTCGRRTPRLSPVLGRKNQMLKLKGTTVFPGTILGILEGVPGVVGGYVEVSRNADGTDRVVASVAVRDGSLGAARLGEILQARLRVRPEVKLVAAEEWEARVRVAGKRKPQVFFDLRGGSQG